MIDTDKARAVLKAAFPFTENTTQYIAVYRSRKGREIALERDRSESYYVWVEKYSADIVGIAVRNEQNCGEPYSVKQSRNSNLNDANAPRLKVGNRVWYLKVDDVVRLRKLVDWYKEI